MKFEKATGKDLPPGSSDETAEALAKIAMDAKMDPTEIAKQLTDHLSLFSIVLRGLVGKESANQLLKHLSEQDYQMHIVEQNDMDAMMGDSKNVH